MHATQIGAFSAPTAKDPRWRRLDGEVPHRRMVIKVAVRQHSCWDTPVSASTVIIERHRQRFDIRIRVSLIISDTGTPVDPLEPSRFRQRIGVNEGIGVDFCHAMI